MFYTFKKIKGVSLIEILIATTIFSIAAVGTFSSLSAIRQSSSVSDRSLQAAYYGRQLFDELRGRIDQGTWDTWDTDLQLTCDGAFHNWPTPAAAGTPFFNAFNGHAQYNCVDINPPGIRKVTLNIIWDEP